MANIFDAVDWVFAVVEKASSGFVCYKGASIAGEKRNHITVQSTGVMQMPYVNISPAVNINVFVRRYDNGMENRNAMKTAVQQIEQALTNGVPVPNGVYFKARVEWIKPIADMKDGFDCVNIRMTVIMEK